MDATALALCSGRMDFGGFPTGAIAVLDFDTADWSDLAEGTGQLVAFCRPPRQ
jgi:phosphohistidine phosphatase SixA